MLADFPEYIQYQDAVAALAAAIRDGELLDVILNRETEVAEAARELGVTERLMGLRTKKHGIVPKHYRVASK